MNIKYITISMATAAMLFTACGGGGDAPKKDDTPIESAVSIQNSVKSFKAVAGDRKLVTMATGKDVIVAGEPNSLFSVVDDGGADASFDEPKNGNNYGILTFKSDTPATYNVVVNVKNSAGTSADETFTFEVVAESDAVNITRQAILATSRATDYNRDNSTGFNVQDSSTGLEWNDNDAAGNIINRTYTSANEKCTGDWRLPTLNELLDIIDYSKPYLDGSMLPDKFQKNAIYMWVEAKNGKNYFVDTRLGMTSVDTAGQELLHRCVKGAKYETSHLVSTKDSTGATYDYTTGLKWSRASSEDGKAGAEAYCGGSLHEEDGWRLPTINELRSIVEDSVVPSSIVAINTGGEHLTLVSSTASNDSTDGALPMRYGLQLFWDRSEPWVVRFYDSGENAQRSVSCVKGI